jgi:hypothetical protein
MQSTTKTPLTKELVARAQQNLDAIPPAPEEMLEVSVTEAIRLLMPTLQKLFKKGYKRTNVVEFLREQGIECSEATLKTLYRAPKSKKDKAGKAGETGTATNDGAASDSSAPGTTTTVSIAPRATPAAPAGDRKSSPSTAASGAASVTAKAS